MQVQQLFTSDRLYTSEASKYIRDPYIYLYAGEWLSSLRVYNDLTGNTPTHELSGFNLNIHHLFFHSIYSHELTEKIFFFTSYTECSICF